MDEILWFKLLCQMFWAGFDRHRYEHPQTGRQIVEDYFENQAKIGLRRSKQGSFLPGGESHQRDTNGGNSSTQNEVHSKSFNESQGGAVGWEGECQPCLPSGQLSTSKHVCMVSVQKKNHWWFLFLLEISQEPQWTRDPWRGWEKSSSRGVDEVMFCFWLSDRAYSGQWFEVFQSVSHFQHRHDEILMHHCGKRKYYWIQLNIIYRR